MSHESDDSAHAPDPLLEVSGLRAGYGDFQALFDIDLHIDDGEAIAIIGSNGAGKTTLLRTLCGVVPASDGEVRFDGVDLLAVKPHRRVEHGVAMVPEGRRLFPSLSVRENLIIGGHTRRQTNGDGWTVEGVLELFPMIERLLDRPSGQLSGGEKQAVAIGRSLISNPRLLLMDECSLGLAPAVVKDLYAAMPQIRSRGTSVLVVEQDITQALEVADRVYCFLEGRVALSGLPGELSREEITSAYFGIDSPQGGAE